MTQVENACYVLLPQLSVILVHRRVTGLSAALSYPARSSRSCAVELAVQRSKQS